MARGISWDRLDCIPPPICKSLNVSSRITAKLLVRRKLHDPDLLIVSKVCSIRSYIDSTFSAETRNKFGVGIEEKTEEEEKKTKIKKMTANQFNRNFKLVLSFWVM